VGVAEEAWLTELDYWNIPLPEEPEPIESVDAAEAAAREAARKAAATQAETNLTNRLAMVARNRPLFLERTFNRLVTELSSVLLGTQAHTPHARTQERANSCSCAPHRVGHGLF
jgi:hypothetical protein